jgi:hypothetical protein
MLTLNSPGDIARVGAPGVQALLARRLDELCQGEPYDPDRHGSFLIVEAGDSVAAIEAAGGCWIASSLFGDAHYGDADFAPCHEVLEEHPACFELVFVFGDTATAIIVPKFVPGIDPVLLNYCREYSTPTDLPPA